MVHVKGHSGDIGNDYADRFVQDGKGTGPFSRLGYLVLRLAPKNATDTQSCPLWRYLLNYRRHETGLDWE